MESMITTSPPYFSSLYGYDNSSGGGGYLEDILQQLHYIPNSYTTNLLLYHPPPPLHLDSTTSLNTHITSNELSTSTSESSIRSRKSAGVDDQESVIFPIPEQSNYYSQPLEHAVSSSLVNDINTNYTYDQAKKSTLFSITCQENNNEERMKMKMRSTKRRRLVYHPFALVKPGGEEGDVTLNDINTRMLMPPTRPIHHPVGRFASRPCLSNPHRKPILALTTIRTLGTGTLTIIRTKT